MLEHDLIQLIHNHAQAPASQIRRQPALWREVAALYRDATEDINDLIGRARAAAGVMGGDEAQDGIDGQLLVVLTGSDLALNAAQAACDAAVAQPIEGCDFTCVSCADLASAPADYVRDQETVLLVALSRGDDEDLLSAVAQVRSQTKNLFVLGVTCSSDDPLATALAPEDDGLVVALPLVASAADDASTAPVDSEPVQLAGFMCLALFATLCLDTAPVAKKLAHANQAAAMGDKVIMDEAALASLALSPFDALCVLSDGPAFAGVAREARDEAKNFCGLEERSIEVRMGDVQSAALDNKVLHDALGVALVGGTDDDRASQVAALQEMDETAADNGCTLVALQPEQAPHFTGRSFTFDGFAALPCSYLGLPYLMAVQVLLLAASVK